MATLALFSWPLLAMALFNTFGRMKGVIWGILIPTLTLPERFEYDLPALPPYDKEMAIVVGLLLGLWVTRERRDNPPEPAIVDPFVKKVVFGLVGLLLLSAVLTVMANQDRLNYPLVSVRGLSLRDLISMLTASVLLLSIFLIAQRHLSDPEAHVELLKAFVIAGLVYSFLILFEVRMSPQLHRWTYGYFQHSWHQHIRGGNFRPIVFLPHGLHIGIFLITCLMAAFILLKNKVKAGEPRVQFFLVGLWLFGVLFLSRNLGATMIGLIFVPVLWFLRYKMQVWVAIVVMALFLVHPVLRQAEVVTFETVAERVGQFAPARQQSLEFRLDHEASFMAKALERPVTGWGIWGRWRVRDPATGYDISTSDGRWISVLGERGWVGFIAYFGLLTFPTFLLLRAARRRELTQATAGLSLILAAILIYQIPNNTIGPLVLVFAGALAGFVLRAPQHEEDSAEPVPEAPTSPYTRFPHQAQGRASYARTATSAFTPSPYRRASVT